MSSLVERLASSAPDLDRFHVVVLPDIFVDHLVPVPDAAAFDLDVSAVRDRGGGNIHTPPQTVRVGGNAANAAHALGRLGVPCSLVARTDAVGTALARQALGGLPVELDLVEDVGHASATVALEFAEGPSNVMLSDAGPLAAFGPGDIPDAAWQRIAESDAVLVTNWAHATAHGTELVAEVVQRASAGGARVYLDTADPSDRAGDDAELLDALQRSDGLTAWSMNETEAQHFGALLGVDASADADEAAERIAREIGGRVDLHTTRSASSFDGDGTTSVASFDVRPVHLTGAGDAWVAGDILGDCLGLSAAERLTLANAVAAGWITAADGVAADPPRITALLERHARTL